MCLPPVTISKILKVKEDLTWEVYAQNHFVTAATNPALTDFSVTLRSTTFYQLIHAVHNSNVCVGNYDKQFIKLAHSKRGFFYSINKQLVAVLEKSLFCC